MSAPEKSSAKVRPTRGDLRRAALVGSGVALLVCVVAVLALCLLSALSVSVLVGTVTGFQIAYVAVMVDLASLVAVVFLLPTRPAWLFLKVPFAIVAGLTLVAMTVGLLFVADTKVTPLLVDGCASGYSAVEPSGGGGSYIGVREGIRIVSIQTFSGDDFDRPFASGDYDASKRGDLIEVTHAGDPGNPTFRLPILDRKGCD